MDDSMFPIESEKNYLTALICMFHLMGDPRGRGNFSTPSMLMVTWKLSLLSLCTENRKVHDSEFSEELFDAILSNLHNHKETFRVHQNTKLKRVELENVTAIPQGNPNDLKKSTTNSSRRQINPVDRNQYVIDKFEMLMDQDMKKKNTFDLAEWSKQRQKSIADQFKIQSSNISSSMVNNSVIGKSLATGANNLKTLNDQTLSKSQIEDKKDTTPFKQPGGRLSHLHQQLVQNFAANPEIFSETSPNNIHLKFDESKDKTLFWKMNNAEMKAGIPEVPFIHWSIYRQGIQNLLA
jgi:hypothetical protein